MIRATDHMGEVQSLLLLPLTRVSRKCHAMQAGMWMLDSVCFLWLPSGMMYQTLKTLCYFLHHIIQGQTPNYRGCETVIDPTKSVPTYLKGAGQNYPLRPSLQLENYHLERN